jgi:N-acylglucosamine 2-epimerase
MDQSQNRVTNDQKMHSFALQYKEELTNNILPFWLKHSIDQQFGGFFTCLDQKGNVYDTDKFIWLQGRQVWCFSYMYQNVEANSEWLKLALHGANFLQKYGRAENGDWYFSLTQDGRPIIQPYNIFSDCFATMAFAALYKIDPNPEWKKIAIDTFDNIIERKNNPKGIYNKQFPGTRELKNFSLPMILCNLSLELEPIIGKERVDEFLLGIIHEVMNVFYQPEIGLILENVYLDGTISDSFEGRLVNPGHSIEAMWFIMDLAKRLNDTALINKALEIIFNTLDFGWDKKYGGILYFKDVKGYPPQQLEWDQKLWWVHVEALVALAKGYVLTRDPRCVEWFTIIHDYTWSHFKDMEYGEWFGYLNRRAEVLLPLKGGKWKGCFHIPRALYLVSKELSSIKL